MKPREQERWIKVTSEVDDERTGRQLYSPTPSIREHADRKERDRERTW